ncbi:MAG TPA: KpsF/GutQ family sugar-phosphate isomerase [Desulfobulbaceae bacterium]|nr:MAG: arabinose-5-phosphate isomerase [Deltaproteobacteria bacterium RIFOXYD12_FULL_53_23]HCC53501.1 KpsF/GutQ family sugar-phosphate isomerase [Desulfobulbaceae bacterium]
MSIEQAKEVLKIEAEGIISLLDQLDADFEKAVTMIMTCSTRVIITGIGKSGIIGQKIAATMNSTGTPAMFLHPVEAMHGDLGMVDAQDIILAISYSGETAELSLLLPNLKKRGAKIIAMTGNPLSSLALGADAVLKVAVPREACPLGLAPTTSTTAALAMGDALAVVLLNLKQFKESDFRRNHPAGSLGERLKVNVAEVMLTGAAIPRVTKTAPLTKAIAELNLKNLGAVLVMQDEKIIGILTDGDLRRFINQKGGDLRGLTLADTITKEPKVITTDLLAADALSIMQRHEITFLAVTDHHGKLAGVLHLQDLLGKGEFRFLV